MLADFMRALPGGQLSFLAVSIVAFIVLGTVLEGIPAMVLFGPLLFRIARSLGIHEVHYAIVAITAMGIRLFAPPFGVGYYMACAISKVDPDAGMRPIVPYLIALILGLAALALVPWFSIGFLWLADGADLDQIGIAHVWQCDVRRMGHSKDGASGKPLQRTDGLATSSAFASTRRPLRHRAVGGREVPDPGRWTALSR